MSTAGRITSVSVIVVMQLQKNIVIGSPLGGHLEIQHVRHHFNLSAILKSNMAVIFLKF